MPNKFLTTTAWVLEPKTLEIVDQIISARLTGEVRDLEQIELALGRPMKNERPEKPYEVFDGVAVIQMIGVMGKRFDMFSAISGGVSTQRLQATLEDALTDPEILAVVMQIDSPGGTVDGTAELCDWLMENKGLKPVHAYVDGQGCSGAYWLASCCDRITAFRTAQVGSISAVTCHYDRSGADSKAGIKRTFISSGEYKRMANDAEPLNEKGTAYLQGFIDRYHAMFIEAVAEGRGISPEDVQAKFGNGQVHLAAEALAIGMIDGIGTLPETIKAARDAAMEEEPMNREEFAAKHPELHAELMAEAQTKARAELADQVKTEGDAMIAAEQTRLFGLYGKLHGVEAGASFAKLAGSGMTVAQLEGLEACGFGMKGGGEQPGKEKGLKEKILDSLEKNSTELQAGGGGAPADFMAAVDAEVEKSRCTRIEAMKKVARTHPELHEAYKKGLAS
jgi:signal peptide peptidase SppA